MFRSEGSAWSLFLLASAVTVPWLSQAVCLPLYRAIGSLVPDGDMDKIHRRLSEVWPAAFVQSLPLVALFAAVVQAFMSWSWIAFTAYLALCLLHVAFAQSLVASNVGRRRVRWAVAWGCYAAALLLAPTAWYLPPLVGLVSQLVLMYDHRPVLRHVRVLPTVEVARELIRASSSARFFWSDKFFLFLKTDGLFEVNAIFIGLLPAVLAYNYYFVRLAPHIDQAVGAVRLAIEKESKRSLIERTSSAFDAVTLSISGIAFIGAFTVLMPAVLVGLYMPAELPLVAAVSIASFLFMMTTLVCYKLDYLGSVVVAQRLSAIHLLICATAFVALPIGAPLYVWLIGLEGALFLAALYTCLENWRSAEYALFWRHAMAW